MFQLSKANPSSMMGIDISCSAVTLLEISENSQNLHVEAYARKILPFNVFQGDIIADVDAIKHCIETLLAKAPFKSKQVVLAIPDSLVISKILQVSANLSPKALEEFVSIKAEHYFPSLEEISLDFKIIGSCSKNPSMLDVFMIAAKAESLNLKLQAISQADLEAQIVDVESYAIARSALLCIRALNQEQLVTVFMYLGLNSSYLLIFHGGKLIFTKEEQFGEIQLLEAVATHYQISLDKARAWVSNKYYSEDYNALILNPFKSTLLLHIKRTLELFYTSSLNLLVQHVFLAGSLVRPLMLDVLIREQLSFSASFANPLLTMSLPSSINETLITYDAPALMIACGLALRNIN